MEQWKSRQKTRITIYVPWLFLYLILSRLTLFEVRLKWSETAVFNLSALVDKHQFKLIKDGNFFRNVFFSTQKHAQRIPTKFINVCRNTFISESKHDAVSILL